MRGSPSYLSQSSVHPFKGSTHAILVLVLVLSSSFLILTSHPASADTGIVWTSTADFDSGTKSQPIAPDGNYEVETQTDNPKISTGSFELSSLKGDSFTVNSLTGQTSKWYMGWASCTVNTPTTIIRSVSGGTLNLGSSRASGTNDIGVVTSNAYANGDVDVKIKITRTTSFSGSGNWFGVWNEQVCKYDGSGTVDGALMQYAESGGSVRVITLYSILNGGASSKGTATVSAINPIWERLTLIGSSWTGYYSSDGLSWTSVATFTNAISGSISVAFEEFDPGAQTPATQFNYDDFTMSVGTLQSPQFRASGNWFSPTYIIPDGFQVSAINITHSGLTATYAIDRIELIRNGVVREAFYTDIISGSYTNETPQENYSSNDIFQIRIYLKGDGAGTPNIDGITIFISTVVTTGGGLSMVLWLLLIVFLITLVVGFVLPGIHLLCGIIGIFLAIQIFSETASLPLAGIIAGLSLLVMVASIARLYEART